MKKMFLLLIVLFIFLAGCNNKQISNTYQENDENTTTITSSPKDETINSIVPVSKNSNYIAPIPKTIPEYIKTDIKFNGGYYFNNNNPVSIFDNSKIIVPISYDDVISDSVYNNDGTVFIDGDIHNNEFSDKPNRLSISKAYGKYTIVESEILELKDNGVYFTDNGAEKHIFLYNIETKKKTEIKNMDYAKLQGKYIITDKGILDTELVVVLPENKEYSYEEIVNDELIIARNTTNGKVGLLNLDGQIIADFIYSNIYSFYGGNYLPLGIDVNPEIDVSKNFVEYTVATKSFTDSNGDTFEKPVIIDLQGNENKTSFNMDYIIIEDTRFISQYNGKTYFTFDKDIEYIKGLSKLPSAKTGTSRFIADENGEIVLDNFINVSGFINGYCVIDMNKLVNLNGETIFETNGVESSIHSVPDSQGLFIVSENGIYTIYDLAKNIVYSSDKIISSFGNGFFVEKGFDEEYNEITNYFSITQKK